MKEKFDIYQMITDRFIAELEKGQIPWKRPWTGVRSGAFNRITKKPYSLLNQMLLEHEGEYASYKQWTELGGKPKKGTGEVVTFWKINHYEKENEEGEKETYSRPVLRYYYVFHISNVEGVEPLDTEDLNTEIKSIDDADNIIQGYVERSGIEFSEELSNKAYYSPLFDKVVVPSKEQYEKIEEYYSTTFHELAHSTGAKGRLDRFTDNDDHKFGSESYSKEELIAEISASTMVNLLGIETPDTFTNSAAYVQNWLQVLKNDSKMIISASSKAKYAVNMILGEDICN